MEKPKQDPALQQNAQQAAAKTVDDVLDKATLDTLMNADPNSLIGADASTEQIKGPANPSSCWIHGPAQIEMNAAADKRLTKTSAQDGMPVSEVTKADVKLIPNTTLCVVKAAPANDLRAADVNRWGKSGAWINAFDVLGPAHLTVESGYKARFDVAFIPKSSPLWPGLVIDLSKPRERRYEGKKKEAEPSESK